MTKYILFILLSTVPVLGITGDFNADHKVNFLDYGMLAVDWQKSTPDIHYSVVDMNGDGTVDFKDLALFCNSWLEFDPDYFPPVQATSPDPASGALQVAVNKVLSWQRQAGSTCDVWFGTVAGGMSKVVSSTTSTSYDPPGSLSESTQYNWRIDTINGTGTTTGVVWDFTTVSGNTAPETTDASATPVAYIVSSIQLTGTDDGLPAMPGKLKYIITSLPVHGYLQDPVSGGQSRITAVPYRLSGWNGSVLFATDTAGADSFQFKTFDGQLYSNTSTVNLTVSANPQDCLSFDGQGYVTVADNDLLDLAASRGIGLCFSTRSPYCRFLKKHETGQPGYAIGLVGGKVSVNIYSATGLVGTIKSSNRYDNGGWTNCVFAYDGTNNRVELYINYGEAISGTNWYELSETYLDEQGLSIPAGTYTNDCQLIIGTSDSIACKWEIDAIRTYNLTMTDGFRSLCSMQIRTTAGNTDSWVPSPVMRFACNYDGTNNTITQIYDDVSASHLTGSFSSSDHVKYIPFYWHWYDSAAYQMHNN
jgi:hypothetical protein